MSRKTGNDTPVNKDENEWCDQRDRVADGDRIYRCSTCRKRLHPREIWEDGRVTGWQLPPHKKKGHKIRAAKLRQQKIRKGRNRNKKA